jgi:nucleotide-binding universal stress UspA family protein
MNNDIKTILYAADLGASCEGVLAYAIGMANRLGARLKVLTVIPEEREKSLVEVDRHVPQATLDKYHDDHAQRIRQHIEGQIAAFYAVRPDKDHQPISEITVREGDDVAQLILDEAKASAADLVLMGSRPERAIVGLLFGSVVQEVIRKTAVPLLLVPIDD